MDTFTVRRFTLSCWFTTLWCGLLLANPCFAEQAPRPSWNTLKALASQHLGDGRTDRGPISQSQVADLLNGFEQAGWSVSDADELINRVLPDDHILVRELHTAQGKKFLGALTGDRTLFDRMDRVSREAGGEQLIHDLLRLPDGARLARLKPTRGAPDLVDLLPKNASGKRRQVKDYHLPTGRFYTAEALIEELEHRYNEERAETRSRK